MAARLYWSGLSQTRFCEATSQVSLCTCTPRLMTYFDQQHLNGPDAFIMLLVIYCRKLCSLLSPSFSPIIILFIFIKVFQLSLSQSIINIKSFCQCLQLTLCFGIFVIITPGNIKLADNINSDNCNNMVEASCVAGCSGKFGERPGGHQS